MAEDTSGTKTPTPGFILPGLRCGAEMALVGTIILLVGLPTEDPTRFGIVVLAAGLAMTVVLFWAVGRHVRRWIRYAQGKPTRNTPFD